MPGDDPEDEERRRLAAVESTGLGNAPDPAMDRLAALASRLLGSPVGLVSLVDDHRQFFPGQAGLPSPISEARETPLTQSLCRTVVESGAVLQIDDAAADPRWQLHGAHTVLGVASYLGAPLLDADARVLGSFCAMGAEPRHWTDEERRTILDLSIAASSELQARIATHRAHAARAAAELALAQVRLMADVSNALASSMQTDVALRRMLDVLVDDFAAWAMVVYSPSREEPTELIARHRDPERSALLAAAEIDPHRRIHEMPMTRSILTGERSIVVLDGAEARIAASAPGATAQIFLDLDLGPLAIVPIVSSGTVVGAFAIGREPNGSTFDATDVTLVGDLAHRAAMALTQSSLFAREHQIAAELQHSLLPDLPRMDAIGVDVIYSAGARGVDVGGDWYDLVDLGDGSFVASIGDVTGHNIRAAAAMGRVQSAIRLLAVNGLGPDAIVARIDQLSPMLLGDLLATCIVIRLSPNGHDGWMAEIANAGHLSPVLVDAHGPARLIDLPPDALIGGRSAATRSSTVTSIGAGSTLILYTDGLVEHRHESIDVSLEALRAAAERLAPGPIDGILDRIVLAVTPDFRDDIAGMALRC